MESLENNIRIAKIISQHITGQISAEEKMELEMWLQIKEANQVLFDRIIDNEQLAASLHSFVSSDTDAAFQEVKLKIEQDSISADAFQENTLYRKLISSKWMGIAAAILLSITVGVYLYNGLVPQSISKQLAGNDIAPGVNRATLTLADGQIIDLSDLKEGIVIGENEVKYVDGTHVIGAEAEKTVRPTDSAPIQTLTLTTPIGGQYQVTLPDGTKVWLNAESILKYPVRFIGPERRVELEGEAYFEVAHNKNKPFIAISKGQKVEVLGTQFNINAYADEPGIKTSLVQGSVSVSLPGNSNGHSTILIPGQQSIVKDEQIKVQNINLKQAIAWKNGRIEFESSDIYSIMRMLSRWYAIDVVYEPNLKDVLIGGSISKYRNISEVLAMLESTGEVHFKVESSDGNSKERRIIVMR